MVELKIVPEHCVRVWEVWVNATDILVFLTCWIIASLTFHTIKWMILNWPED